MKPYLILVASHILALSLPLSAIAQPATTTAASRATAICSAGDQPETGMQGETPLKDIESGRNKSPYYCGMRLVSQTALEGGGGMMRRSRSCVYIAQGAGVRVVDMSNPKAPKALQLLTDPGAVGTSENLNVVDTADRHVLVTGKYSSALTNDRSPMSIYDITDCTKPKLMSTYYWPGDVHVPAITPDGKKVVVSLPYGVAGVKVLDISNLAEPKFVGAFPLLLPRGRQARCHDLGFSADGTRMYCPGSVPTEADRESEPGPSIWDFSAVMKGNVNVWPPIRFVGEADVKGQGDHDAPLAMINGKPYLVSGAELGCNVGRSDFPTIFDISDEKNPRKVGEFRLEVMDHCASDPAFKATQKVNYGLHYNNVVDNAWGKIPLGMFSYQSAGVRIIDLRDPIKPREVAYYHPGAPAAPAPAPAGANVPPGAPNARAVFSDACASHNYFDQATGHIWFACRSGLYVAELTPAVEAYLGVPRAANRQ